MAIKIMTTHRLRFSYGGRTWESKGRSLVEDAPDFVKDDPFFAMNVRRGRLVDFSLTALTRQKPEGDTASPAAPSDPEAEEEAQEANRSTAREVLSLNAKEAQAAIAVLEDLEVLRLAKTFESQKRTPRKSVLTALNERIDAIESEILNG